jgi:hypothetical protein
LLTLRKIPSAMQCKGSCAAALVTRPLFLKPLQHNALEDSMAASAHGKADLHCLPAHLLDIP